MKEAVTSVCSDFDNIIVMTSGGVDSMFLADFISNVGLDIIVAHFQHGIRDNDHNEVELVKSFAQTRNHRFILGNGVDLKGIRNLEAVARNQRWLFIEEYIETLSGKTIVLTAHHHSDNVEHLFMSVLRGKPLEGLVMKRLIDFGKYYKYKPLLDLTKEQIYNQAKRRRLSWIEDPTNQFDTPNYERNFFRNKIFPLLGEIRNYEKSTRGLITQLSEMKGEERLSV
jgi:tRNA(Ile)-lysidine synthetase-like protein